LDHYQLLVITNITKKYHKFILIFSGYKDDNWEFLLPMVSIYLTHVSAVVHAELP